MRENTIRELSANELDMVGGGLTIPLPNPAGLLGDIGKAINGVAGAIEGLAGSVLKGLGGLLGGIKF